MKIPVIITTFVLSISFLFGAPSNLKISLENEISAFSEGIITERLTSLSTEIPMSYHPDVKAYIKEYALNGIHGTRRLVGRSILFFPIIEHYLKVSNLPEDLKYLAVVESKLNPGVMSGVGAAGLWQFMEGTAKENGLVVNSQVDERKDAIKSTEAAALYLTKLYNNYEDWLLVLAAYNCGPGTVNKAIRQSGSRDFWTLRRFLPQQTQKYIPRFIAAAYISNYYHDYKVQPKFPDFGAEALRPTRIYAKLSLKDLAKSTGISVDVIQKLNPSYRKGYVPASARGNYLLLPESGVAVINANNYSRLVKQQGLPVNSIRSKYIVKSGDTIYGLSRLFKCSVNNLQDWNGLDDASIYVGQELVLYVPKSERVQSL